MKTSVSLVAVSVFLAFPILGPARDSNRTPGIHSELSQTNSPQPYALSRIKGKVTLDGLSYEPAWEGIEPLPVVVFSPNAGASPSERTEILVAYDDDFLYVAGRLYDREPDKIQATSKKRDDMKLSNDWVGVTIDAFHDHENALAFFTTPAGLRLDMTIFKDCAPDFPANPDWNTFWDAKTVRNKDGWFAEMRIPLSSLRFQTVGGRVVMGLIAWRFIARKNEIITFPAISAEWGFWGSFKPSQARDVVLEGLSNPRPFYVAPYLLGGYGRSFELNDPETAYERIDMPVHEAGVDVKYGLTNNLTLDLTANTDFAQVEADDQQVNMTRFSLFFPEKRLFFLERASVFDFNYGDECGLFYSRRIGIYEEDLVRIYGGARLVGRVGGWDLGFLDMQTAAVEGQPSENAGVLRVRRQVFNSNSWVGGMVTSRLGANGSYNTAYGLDGSIRLFGRDYLFLNWAQTFSSGKRNEALSLAPAKLRIGWQRWTSKGFAYNLGFMRAGKDYDPGLGFEFREDYSWFGKQLLYGWLPGERSHLWRHAVFFNGSVFLRNADGAVESSEFGPGWQFQAKSGLFAKFSLTSSFENVFESFSLSDQADIPAGRYHFAGLNVHVETPYVKSRYLEGTLYAGSFYDGRRISLTLSPRWDISSGLEMSATYQFDRATFTRRGQRFVSHIARLRVLAMLSIKFSAAAFVQYNSAADIVTANVRFRYNPREGTDLYVVYNGGLNTSRFREIPVRPSSSGQTILVKYSYTFNLR